MTRKVTASNDTAFIRNYDSWPCWPFCPLKRGNHSLKDKNLGVLLATQAHADAVSGQPGAKVTVYHGYMYGWPRTPEGVKALPTTEYSSIEALLADGWVVD